MRNKVVRIFVSSTFEDMKVERNLLQEHVLPRVTRYCNERGWAFSAVDLRWGITTEASLNQRTMQICLNELDVCQRISPKPNFLVMLGDRYGWLPLPERIDELHMFLLQNRADARTRALLDAWYVLDMNCMPTSYVLRQRTGRFVDRDIYTTEVETPLVAFINEVASEFPGDEIFEEMVASATGQEVIHGALSTSTDPRQHVIFYDRITPRAADDVHYPRLKAMRERLVEKVDPSRHLDYKTLGYGTTSYAARFVEAMTRALTDVVDAEIRANAVTSALDEELSAVEQIVADEAANFVGREDDRRRLWQLIDASPVTLVAGPSGVGKTALMCVMASEAAAKGWNVVKALCGATPYTASAENVIRLILKQMGVAVNDDMTLPLQLNDAIARLDGKVPTMLVVDSMDRVDAAFSALSWLPSSMGRNVRVVISSTPDEGLERRVGNVYRLPMLDSTSKLEMLRSVLARENRGFSAEAQPKLLDALERGESTPLYVTLFAALVKNVASFMDLSARVDNPTVNTVFSIFLDLQKSLGLHSPDFMRIAIEGLTLTEYGISDDEMLRWAPYDEQYMAELERSSFHEIPQSAGRRREIPQIIWSRLYNDLSILLTRKSVGNAQVLNWRHARIDGVAQHWVQGASADGAKTADGRLRRFYYDEMMQLDSVHALYELPHLGSGKDLVNLLFDFDYLARRIRHGLTKELLKTRFTISGEHPRMLDELARFEINAATIVQEAQINDLDEIKRQLFALASSYRADSLIGKKLRECYPEYCETMMTDVLALPDGYRRPLNMVLGSVVPVRAIDDAARQGIGCYKGKVYLVDLATGQEQEIAFRNLPPVDRVVVTGPDMRYLLMICKAGNGCRFIVDDRQLNKIVVDKTIAERVMIDRVFMSENPECLRVAVQSESESGTCSYYVISAQGVDGWEFQHEGECWLTAISGDGRYLYFQVVGDRRDDTYARYNGYVRYDIAGREAPYEQMFRNRAFHDCSGMAVSYDGNIVVLNSDHYAVVSDINARSYRAACLHQHRMDSSHARYRLSPDGETFVSSAADGNIVVARTADLQILHQVKTGNCTTPTRDIVNYQADKAYAVPYEMFAERKNKDHVHSYVWREEYQQNLSYRAEYISDIDSMGDTIVFTPVADALENNSYSIFVVDTASGTKSVIYLPREMDENYNLPSQVAITGRDGEFVCCIALPYVMVFRDGQLYDHFKIDKGHVGDEHMFHMTHLHDRDGVAILYQVDNTIHAIVYDVYAKSVRRRCAVTMDHKLNSYGWGYRLYSSTDDVISFDIGEDDYMLVVSEGRLVKSPMSPLKAIVKKAYPQAKVMSHCWKACVFYVVSYGRILVVEVNGKGAITERGFHDILGDRPIFHHYPDGLAWTSGTSVHAIKS